jgi:hypothetical protein
MRELAVDHFVPVAQLFLQVLIASERKP